MPASKVTYALAATLAALAGTGCFYGEPINDRPSAEIQRLASSDLRRGGHVDVSALVSDPDGDEVFVRWAARACAADGTTCDATPIAEGTSPLFTVEVPAQRTSGDLLATVTIMLDVIDVHGAQARPPQSLIVDLVNQAPSLALQVHTVTGGDTHTVGLPSWFVAQIGDVDDGPDGVTLTWALEPPREATAGDWTFDDPGDPPSGDPLFRQAQRRLTTATPGVWTVRATATDAIGAITTATLGITVDADRPPCIAALVPSVPPVNAALLFDQPRRFEVQVVDDDRAPYPAPTDPYRQVATFRWFLATPTTGGDFAELVGSDGNAVELDPADFAPGEQLAVRVEIDDGEGRAMACAADDPTCSFHGNSCVQRQTWALEVR